MKLQRSLISRMAAMVVMAGVMATSGLAQGPGAGPGPRPGAPGTQVALEPATAAEIQWMKFMREEEKLARDVYRFLYEKWNLSVFDRIAGSEQQHFTAVGTLLTRYKVEDPVAVDTPGVFVDQRLGAMYAELTAKGAASLKDALEVGVAIEKADIDDLSKALLETNKWDLKRVFNNLSAASFSHLDAFESYLEILAAL
ncbi:MAG: DUF2202 domain-containing protein [Bryobacterales bacterium]|nr:DUF2202 domain-containing protein [Bryobacterales bacterium]